MAFARLRVGVSWSLVGVALFATIPLASYADDVKAKKNYVNPEVEALKKQKEPIEAQMKTVRENPTIDAETKKQLLASGEAKLAEIDLKIKTAQSKQAKANKKDQQILETETAIKAKREELKKLNDEWAQVQGLATPEIKEKFQASQTAIQADIAGMERKIERKEKGYERKTGESYRPAPKTIPVDDGRDIGASGKASTGDTGAGKTSVGENGKSSVEAPVMTDLQKMELPGCWKTDTSQPQKFVAYFDTGSAKLEPGHIPEKSLLNEEFYENASRAFAETKKHGGRIGKIDVVVHNSVIPTRQGRTSAALAEGRKNEAIANFNTVMRLEVGDTKNAFAPSSEGPDSIITKKYDGEDDTGIPYVRERSAVAKKTKPVRDPKNCDKDDFCRRAKRLYENRTTDKSAALVMKDGKFDQEATVRNLMSCCSENLYDLAYKPSQYAEMTIYPSKFVPEAPECADPTKVVSKTGKGSVGGGSTSHLSGDDTPPGTSEMNQKSGEGN